VRPYWKGYLKLALVSCPIALHAACSSSERIAFRQINKANLMDALRRSVQEDNKRPAAARNGDPMPRKRA
jgi:DNA end-binding protein Ku